MSRNTAKSTPTSDVFDTYNVTSAAMAPTEVCTSADWPVIDDAAYHGLAGKVVRTMAPHTEADPVAILVQILVMFGNVIGSAPYYRVEADRHHTNLFGVLVWNSSKGRKGTAGSRARSIMERSDESWIRDRIKGGLSSGEGLIEQVRDEVERWNPKEMQYELVDPGVSDKRLMVIEPEFSTALSVMERSGSTLSSVIRKAWDSEKLSTLTRNSPLSASDPHISIIGHITDDELRAKLTRTEMANGFANRFLFVAVRRSKELPHGGSLNDSDLLALSDEMKAAVTYAKNVGKVEMTDASRRYWEAVYHELSAGHPGLLGAVTARAEAQTIRLALVYALLDLQDRIDVQHLEAALALWEYCEATAAWVFGTMLGDAVADDILSALRQAGEAGVTRTAIRDLFGKHKSGDQINAALALLAGKGWARLTKTSTGGRALETWFASGA